MIAQKAVNKDLSDQIAALKKSLEDLTTSSAAAKTISDKIILDLQTRGKKLEGTVAKGEVDLSAAVKSISVLEGENKEKQEQIEQKVKRIGELEAQVPISPNPLPIQYTPYLVDLIISTSK